MPHYNESETLPSSFRNAAEPQTAQLQPPNILVTIALDQDVLDFLRRDSEPSDFDSHGKTPPSTQMLARKIHKG